LTTDETENEQVDFRKSRAAGEAQRKKGYRSQAHRENELAAETSAAVNERIIWHS
jgi:hypothetical protein